MDHQVAVQSFSKKWGEKRAGAGAFPRSRASYFRFASFIYVPTVLSESLAQAMPHLGTVWKDIRIVAEVNKQEHTLESAETEVNIQEWELGFSPPDPLG